MAETKYLDLTGLSKYDTKLKEYVDGKDAATLQGAKDFASGLSANYDPAGAASTAKTEAIESAKGYTDGEIAKVNGTVAEVKKTADKGVADAAAAKGAADAADAKATAVTTLVGTLPEDTEATTVVEYINKKTENIASDDAIKELQTTVGQHTTDIAGIKSDYLKAADKTELQNSIKVVDDKVGVLNGTGEGSVKKQVDDALNEFATNVSNDGVVNTFKELVDYCATHGAEAAEMAGDIAKNAQAITKLETFIGKLPEGTQAADVIAYINEKVSAEQSRAQGVESGLDTRLKAVEGKLGDGEDSIASQIEAAKQAAIQAASADATAKSNKAKTDAVTESKTYTDSEIGKVNTAADALGGRVTAVEGKVTALEGKAHTHANADVLDGVTAQKVASWDTAAANQHTHANKADLDKVTSAKISAWDSAEANSKSYADGLFGQFKAITTEEIDALFAQA